MQFALNISHEILKGYSHYAIIVWWLLKRAKIIGFVPYYLSRECPRDHFSLHCCIWHVHISLNLRQMSNFIDELCMLNICRCALFFIELIHRKVWIKLFKKAFPSCKSKPTLHEKSNDCRFLSTKPTMLVVVLKVHCLFVKIECICLHWSSHLFHNKINGYHLSEQLLHETKLWVHCELLISTNCRCLTVAKFAKYGGKGW